MISASSLIAFEHADRLEREITYLSRGSYAFWINNISTAVLHVRSAAVQLQGESPSVHGKPSLISRSKDLDMRLETGSRGAVRISVTAPLLAQAGSNSFSVSADFEVIGDDRIGTPRSARRDQFDYLILGDALSHPAAEVFVSFIDPENYPHAEVTALYLSRAGMQPYLAKRDMRTGCDYWQDKIFPAIDRSAGLLVIWTEETLRRPELVVREIQRAQSSGVPVGLFLARGVQPPDQCPQAIVEYASFDPDDPREAFANAIAAGAATWAKTGRFFD